jgi:pimeloyl-ACP methyl ester carboxylesterase
MRTLIACLWLWSFAFAASADYADVNGLRMYYEVHGTGRPTVLLHGGSDSIAGTFSKQIPDFARSRRIIAPEQRGHGHTADTDAPFSYGEMTEQTATLLERLGVSNADVVGWSDGGIIALMLAIRHPELVRRVVASGANYHPDGYTSASTKWVTDITPEQWRGPGRDYYEKTSPDGAGRWPVFVGKLKKLWLQSPNRDELSLDMLKRLDKPTLLIAGDRDSTRHEHTLEMFNALPKAQVFIVPGTGHFTFQQRPDWTNAVILSFLDAEDKK